MTTPDWCEQALSTLNQGAPQDQTIYPHLHSLLVASSSVIRSLQSLTHPSRLLTFQFSGNLPPSSLSKNGDRSNPNNYRPISILLVPSKLLERHVHLQLSSHLNSSRKVVDSRLNLVVDGCSVEQVQRFKFLGVVINDTLTWSDHVHLVHKKVSRNLNLLRRLSWFLPKPLLVLFL